MALSMSGEVSYSCGKCGFKLNLSSSDRLILNIGQRYSKINRKGILYFLSIDESRFRMYDEVKWQPYYEKLGKWGLKRIRTILLCRNCGSTIGYLEAGPSPLFRCFSGGFGPDTKRYCVNIRTLQPEQMIVDPAPEVVEQQEQQEIQSPPEVPS